LLGENPDLVRLAARAGLKIVLTGVESINPATLESYRKGINLRRLNQNRYAELIGRIRKGGIAFLGAFVIGSDLDDRRVFDSTLDFIQSSHIDVIQVTKPTPLPGTRLWEDLQQAGRIIDQDFPKAWNEYRLSTMLFKPIKLAIEEIYMDFTYIRKVYYGFWETVQRTLHTLFDTKSIIATIIAYKFNTSYEKAFRRSKHFHRYGKMDLEKNRGKLRR